MKKKLLLVIGLSIFITATGCSSNSDKANQTDQTEQIASINETKETDETETPDEAKPDYLLTDLPFDGEICNVPDTVASPEKYTYVDETLRITQEQKDAFIAEYGEEEYESAASSLSQILHIQKKAPIYPCYITELEETYTIEDVVLTSELDGHHITADYISQAAGKDNDTIIMVHGIGGTRRSMKTDILFYLSLGYNVVTYDQRSSGENDGFFYTLGIWEQYDLMDCINYVDKQISSDKKLVVLGQSSGGTSTGLMLANKEAQEKVDYVIFDSPVTSVYDIIKSQLHHYVKEEQIDYVLQSCEDFMNFMYGFGFEDGEVANFVSDTTIPVLIFTSKADNIVPMEQPQLMYDTIKNSNKKIVISEISGHCAIKDTEHELYETEVRAFLGL